MAASRAHPPRRKAAQASARVQQVTLSWLREPDNADHIAQLTQASESLRQIPGVRALQWGPRVDVGRPGGDETFDFALLITFESAQAAHDFGAHPLHIQAALTALPLVSRHLSFRFGV